MVLGGPGTGKTTTLLHKVDDLLEKGYDTERIAFCSFTRQASYGARDRAMARFGGARSSYPYFRTIHSIAFRVLGIKSNTIITNEHMKELCGTIKYDWEDHYVYEGPSTFGETRNGNRCLAIYDYAKHKKISLDEAWRQQGGDVVLINSLKRFVHYYEEYKLQMGLIDFTDLLELFVQHGSALPVDVLILDEAQDLSKLEWEVVRKMWGTATRVIVAGDDDQAIYNWSGADAEELFNLEKSATKELLGVSHRLPTAIFDFSQKLIRRVSKRFGKDVVSGKDGGLLTRHMSLDSVPAPKDGSWLYLARNKYLLESFKERLHTQGYNYRYVDRSAIPVNLAEDIRDYTRLTRGAPMDGAVINRLWQRQGRRAAKFEPGRPYMLEQAGMGTRPWFEAFSAIPYATRSYIRRCLRNGDNILDKPRVTINTIHSAKGAEADHVVLMLDMSPRSYNGYMLSPDAEHRVFYVGATRAGQSLHLLLPQSNMSYRM